MATPCRGITLPSKTEDCAGTADQNAPYIGGTLPADSRLPILAATGLGPGCQPEPGRELMGRTEQTRVRHTRRDFAGGDRPGAGGGCKPTAGVTRLVPVQNPLFESLDLAG
jgi:hypothetical protein